MVIIDRDRVAAALPGYTLGAALGTGAFGLVLRGEHRKMGRPVAIKVMESVGGADFAEEARALARLDHPHIVRAYDYVETSGLCLVVMELLAGGRLTPGMRPDQACAVGLAVATALEHAHTRGVLHRDIKPANILFAADRTVKVADFGIAKLFEGTSATTTIGAGTPAYMAPEQFQTGKPALAADVYSLGVVMYEALTGALPFNPKQPMHALWRQHLATPPPPMDHVPGPIAAVVMRSLAKIPAGRHPDAHSFALDLAAAATDVYGSGWTHHAGLPLHLTDQLRNITQPPPPPATGLAPGGASSPTPWSRRRQPPTPAPATADSSQPIPLGRPLSVDHPIDSVAFSPDGRTLAVGGHSGYSYGPNPSNPYGLVRLWNVHDPARPRTLCDPWTSDFPVRSLTFSPNGRTLAVGTEGAVSLWDMTSPAVPRQQGGPLSPADGSAVAFSPDGRTLAVGGLHGYGRLVELWDVSAPARPRLLCDPLASHDWVRAVAFSPDGRTLAVGGFGGGPYLDGLVWLWDVTDPAYPTPLCDPLNHSHGSVDSVAFSPDGRTLAVGVNVLGGLRRATLWLWDATDPARPRRIHRWRPSGRSGVDSVAFSPDGRTLAVGTGGLNGEFGLWDMTDPGRPRRIRRWRPSQGFVHSLAFSPDGRTLAVVAGEVWLWKVG